MSPLRELGTEQSLLERDSELDAIRKSLDAARSGRGGVLLIEGPAGIGKTRLLRFTTDTGSRLGFTALGARGSELEQSFPFGVVRQLLEPVVTRASAIDRAEMFAGASGLARPLVDPRSAVSAEGVVAVDPSILAHGLYWLTANLAERSPLLLAVDDLHWADEASATWLGYLARRVEGLRLTVVLAARPTEPGADANSLAVLRRQPGVTRLHPHPLTVDAVGGLATAELLSTVEPAFAQAAHEATGGNPFYVTELLRTLHADGITGLEREVPHIKRAGPDAIAHAVLARLAPLPPAHRDVSRAVAVLQPHAVLGSVAALTGLGIDAVAQAADTLLAMGLLGCVDPCEFSHPILRAAIEQEMPPARRAGIHARAATILGDDGAPLGVVASHAMRSLPSGDAGTVETLRRAAREAMGHGAPSGAADYLRRALAEPPSPAQRGPVLLELGTAESYLQEPHAIEHLNQALALADRPGDVVDAAAALANALALDGDLDAAFEVMRETAERCRGHDDEAALKADVVLSLLSAAGGRLAETIERTRSLALELPAESPAARTIRASVAFHAMLNAHPKDEVIRLADRALEVPWPPELPAEGFTGGDGPAVVLLWMDELDRAANLLGGLIGDARRRGSTRGVAFNSAERAYVLQLRGDLPMAEADIEVALTAVEGPPAAQAVVIASIVQVRLLTDRGQAAAAEALAASIPIPPAFERMPIVALLRHAQGAAQLEQRRYQAAAATLVRVGEVMERTGAKSPAVSCWRSDLALALVHDGRRDEAVALVRDELDLAERADVGRARGVALRALGLIEGGETGLAHLAAAAELLEDSPSRLEHARTLIELGAALRRANRRNDARGHLQRGVEIAHRLTATALVDRGQEELRSLGFRPRSPTISGVEALTPSELRVARLAADGMSNKQVAQALFVTVKTVEQHLSNAYGKLAITSRRDLASALEHGAAV